MPNSNPTNSPLVVVALGGNAISAAGREGNIAEQFEQSRRTATVLGDAIDRGFRLVLTHGNGPQVGNILRRVEIASRELYAIPLELCVADTQAGMGYMIGQCLTNEMRSRGRNLLTSTIVTTVLVDGQDPAFDAPSKPIGPRMERSDAELHAERDGWHIREVEPGRFRRIVPSPRPQEILELHTIRALVERGELVICCGGGGIPVVNRNGSYHGAPAVIDKDHTSSLLASGLGASRLVMLTNVEHACTDYQKPTQKTLGGVPVDEAERLLTEGHFASGSMQPKIEAAVSFIRSTNDPQAEAIITRTDKLLEALDGDTGTRVLSN